MVGRFGPCAHRACKTPRSSHTPLIEPAAAAAAAAASVVELHTGATDGALGLAARVHCSPGLFEAVLEGGPAPTRRFTRGGPFAPRLRRARPLEQPGAHDTLRHTPTTRPSS